MPQAAGEPAGAATAERSRKRALQQGDVVATAAAELQLTAALMRAHFGPTVVDEEAGVIEMQVGCGRGGGRGEGGGGSFLLLL